MDSAATPPPYSLPWQLRPAIVATAIRADADFAGYEDRAARHGLTIASTLTVAYRIPGTGDRGQGLMPLVRLAMVEDSPPTGTGGAAVVNPLVGAGYAFVLGNLHLAPYLLASVPVGQGGGDSPDPALATVRLHGQNARAQLENATFAVNDAGVLPGLDVAYVEGGLTAQAEVNVAQLWRVRGAAVQADTSKTNVTSGLHLGYFLLRQLSLGGELHYQRWAQAPLAVQRDPTGLLMDNWTFAVGLRFHVPIGEGVWIRPGIAFERALGKPVSAATPDYNIVVVDVPVMLP